MDSQEGFRAEYIQDGCIIAGQHSVGTELFKVFQLYYNINISDIPEYILNAPEQLLQSAAKILFLFASLLGKFLNALKFFI